ncbi:hypothetical protein UYSO10_2670 [Kosakonia radicincitans]|nr:hypothetical protein UYSO10_2670 [Kosakonia radicincitans]
MRIFRICIFMRNSYQTHYKNTSGATTYRRRVITLTHY